MTFDPRRKKVLTEVSTERGIFEQYQLAYFQATGGEQWCFPVQRISESGGNRLAVRERPYRDGAKVDSTGAQPTRWRLTVLFNNSIEEPGFIGTNGGKPLYPDVLNALLASAASMETGDLALPTRGIVRAKLETYERSEEAELRDSATVDLTFVHDNEDSIDAQAFSNPTVTANAITKAEQAKASSQSDATWNDSMRELYGAMLDIEAMASGPEEFARDLDQQTAFIIGAHNRTTAAFSKRATPGRDTLIKPESHRTQRKLQETQEITARAATQARKGRPATVSVKLAKARSLVEIANILGQPYEDLLAMNQHIADPFYVPAGETVRVLQATI